MTQPTVQTVGLWQIKKIPAQDQPIQIKPQNYLFWEKVFMDPNTNHQIMLTNYKNQRQFLCIALHHGTLKRPV